MREGVLRGACVAAARYLCLGLSAQRVKGVGGCDIKRLSWSYRWITGDWRRGAMVTNQISGLTWCQYRVLITWLVHNSHEPSYSHHLESLLNFIRILNFNCESLKSIFLMVSLWLFVSPFIFVFMCDMFLVMEIKPYFPFIHYSTLLLIW